MADTIPVFFESLAARIDPDRVADIDTVFGFDIAGAGAWTVRLAGGAPRVEGGIAADVSCTIIARAQHFEDMAAATQLKEIFGQ